MAGKKGRTGTGVNRGRTPSHFRGLAQNQCTGCKKIKPFSEFTEANKYFCRDCKRAVHFRRKYGITLEDFDAMFVAQEGVCAICKRRRARYVDHCHKTGKVRGLLCPQCNTAIGYFLDDSYVIRRALKYISE